MKRLFFGLCLGLLGHASVAYAAVFQVADIRIEGLQRVSAGTVFAALPITGGDIVDKAQFVDVYRSIFTLLRKNKFWLLWTKKVQQFLKLTWRARRRYKPNS